MSDEIRDIDISEEELRMMGEAVDEDWDIPLGGEDNGQIAYCYLDADDVL